jgi:hypothetical protein
MVNNKIKIVPCLRLKQGPEKRWKNSHSGLKKRSVGIFHELLTISLLEVHVVYTKNIERRRLKFELRKVVKICTKLANTFYW